MIDCRECRKLIDSDLQDPLSPQDRATVANHLRECHACVTYRKERLKDSSILRRSVDKLTEQAERRETAAPPPPPPRPSLWPWFATAVILIGAAVGIVIYFQMPGDEEEPALPPIEATAPRGPGVAERRPGRPGPASAPTGPASPRPTRRQTVVRGQVTGPEGRPAPGARVALTRSAHPSADCLTTRAGPDGSFTLRPSWPLPAHATAWTAAAVSEPVTVTTDQPVRLTLQPGRRIEGRLTPRGNLDPATMRVTAHWGRAGRAVSDPATDGAFAVTVPLGAQVELRPHRDELRTYSFVPDTPVALPPGYTGRVRIGATSGRVLLVGVFRDSRPLPTGTVPDMITALAASGDEEPFPLRPAPDRPGSFHATVPPGTYQVVVRLRGSLESIQQVSVEEFAQIEVPLVRSPAAVSGRFRLIGGTGTLPTGVTVRRDPTLLPNDAGFTVPIASDGSFRLDGIPWARVTLETVEAVPRRFGPFTAGTDADLPLHPGSRLEGTVRGPNGKPLPGVLLAAETATGKVHGKTDKTGRYRFEGLPAGPVYLYPMCELVRIEAIPAIRDQFRVDVPPSATVPKDLALTQAAPSRIQLRDTEGRPVVGLLRLKTAAGWPVQVATSQPLDATRPDAGAIVMLPPLRPGVYRAEVVEREIYHPMGEIRLPADNLDLVVRRANPTVRLTFLAAPGVTPSRIPMHVELRTDDGRPVSRYVLPQPQDLEIGGLAAGHYEVNARRGSARARGLLTVGAPGEAGPRLQLVLR